MIENFEETVVVKHFRVICDNEKCKYSKVDSYSDHATCCICKKLFCFKCGKYFYIDPGSDRYDHFACTEHIPIVQKIYEEYYEVCSVPNLENMIKKAREKEI